MMEPGYEKVAFWELDLEAEGRPAPAPHSVQPCIHTSGVVDIGIFQEPKDIRVPAQEVDRGPGGKYYSILKLFFRFGASEAWTTATGWLLKDDLVVTAAHCLYHDGQRATCIRACIGYNASSEDAAGDQRLVTRVALPLEWIRDKTEARDIAFLQLNGPFQNATPIAYGTPEVNALQEFAVIGYPADMGEETVPGSKMYEMKIQRNVDLERTGWNMLVYQGDLYGGFSGAPVIRDSDAAAIGVHVRGGSFNSAVVIGGPYGVRIQAYEEVLKMLGKGGDGAELGFETKTDVDETWLRYVNVPQLLHGSDGVKG
ncbi:ATP synthase F1 [Durotheca rogersii]|uniref:ATP synthase F1 n=1 Tax=Durotheca rogersii TaxID=419775 RepID=UPI0022204616|nr:ATP synthase F1 [Durotheca rogersii]KAI5863267.1 ATP synthase F1 [Durotheca rogersii]